VVGELVSEHRGVAVTVRREIESAAPSAPAATLDGGVVRGHHDTATRCRSARSKATPCGDVCAESANTPLASSAARRRDGGCSAPPRSLNEKTRLNRRFKTRNAERSPSFVARSREFPGLAARPPRALSARFRDVGLSPLDQQARRSFALADRSTRASGGCAPMRPPSGLVARRESISPRMQLDTEHRRRLTTSAQAVISTSSIDRVDERTDVWRRSHLAPSAATLARLELCTASAPRNPHVVLRSVSVVGEAIPIRESGSSA